MYERKEPAEPARVPSRYCADRSELAQELFSRRHAISLAKLARNIADKTQHRIESEV